MRSAGLRAAFTGLCLSILAAFCCAPARASKDAVPDWVREAINQPKHEYPADSTALVLLDQTRLTVAPDGTAVENHRHVVRILRPNGRDEGMVFVPFDHDTKILSLAVWSVGADGHEYAVKENEFREIGYPGQGNFFADLHAKLVAPPARDPGSVVAYECSQRREPYLHEKTWFMQSDVPSMNQTFTLELPAGYAYKAVWAHQASVAPIDLEKQHYRWVEPYVAPVDLQDVSMHPAMFALAGRMTVAYGPAGSDLGTWKGLGQWYEQLSRDRLSPSPELAAKASELTAGKTDFYAKTEAVSEYVQKQIRYFVIEMGIGGLQPHAAADIYRNRYGDCKDKATLLSAMLATQGIHAALMMVDHRRGVVDADAPSIVGDHMIAAIELPKGYDSKRLHSVFVAKSGRHYLIFDPTSEHTPFGQLEHNLQGGYGVLFEGPESQVVHIPVLDPTLNFVKRSGTFSLANDGRLEGEVTESRFGDLAEQSRELYAAGEQKEQRNQMNRRLGEDLTGFAVTDPKVENATSLNKDFTTTFNLTADRFARTMGPLLLVRPRVFGSIGMRIDHKARVLPIDLRETRTERDDFSIKLPTDYVLDEIPEPVKLDVGFATYESKSTVENGTLHYSRTLTVREVSLPVERYADLKRLAIAIETDEQNNAVLKKK